MGRFRYMYEKVFSFFNMKINREEEREQDIMSQIGNAGIHIIGETLNQGIKLIDNFLTEEYSYEKLKLLIGILDDLLQYEDSSLDFVPALCMLRCEMKDKNGTDNERLREFITQVSQYTGSEDSIKIKNT